MTCRVVVYVVYDMSYRLRSTSFRMSLTKLLESSSALCPVPCIWSRVICQSKDNIEPISAQSSAKGLVDPAVDTKHIIRSENR